MSAAGRSSRTEATGGDCVNAGSSRVAAAENRAIGNAAVNSRSTGEASHWHALWAKIDQLSAEVANVDKIEHGRFVAVCDELNNAKAILASTDAALDELKVHFKKMVRERKQLVTDAKAQSREIRMLKEQLEKVGRHRDMLIRQFEDQAARNRDLEERNTTLTEKLEVAKAMSRDFDGTQHDSAFEFDAGEIVVSTDGEEWQPANDENGSLSRKRSSSPLEKSRQQKQRRGMDACGSEAWAGSLIQALEEKKPWYVFYDKRVRHAHTFDFSTLHPDAQHWVLRVMQYTLEFRRELWENQHWITLRNDWTSLRTENTRRESRQSRARSNWAQIESDGRLLITKGLISKNVFMEPFIWAFPAEVIPIPIYCTTLEEINMVDRREPARCFYVDKIDEHPFYASKAFEQYSEKYPFFHMI